MIVSKCSKCAAQVIVATSANGLPIRVDAEPLLGYDIHEDGSTGAPRALLAEMWIDHTNTCTEEAK